jgi:hypothetical protein
MNISKIKPYMIEQIHELLMNYANYTGGINVQLSLNSGSENPEYLKELFKMVKTQLESKTFDENVAAEMQEKFYNIVNEERKENELQNKLEEVEDDDTLDDKYYIINYDEEPFIPQQHYFNSFYMVEQVMYDQEEAQQALQQGPEEGEMEYDEQNQYPHGYEQEEGDPREHEYDPRYEQDQNY